MIIMQHESTRQWRSFPELSKQPAVVGADAETRGPKGRLA